MLAAIGVVVGTAIAGVLAYAATRPGKFRVQRSAVVAAPPERVFALIEDFAEWRRWSPWEGKDPAMKRTYGATTRGKDATYAWEGNKEVGQGRMTITESAPPSRLVLDLDFVKPFAAHNKVEFVLRPSGQGTEVTWSMEGESKYPAKVIGVFVDMDRMIGKDFEAGLANLAAAAQRPGSETAF